jgi:hypothetical protein
MAHFQPLIKCFNAGLCAPPLGALHTKDLQEALLPSQVGVPASARSFLTLPVTAGLSYRAEQGQSVLLGCLGQGLGGPTVMQVLQGNIRLSLQQGAHPASFLRSHLPTQMLLTETLLATPGMLDGLPAETEDDLQAGVF